MTQGRALRLVMRTSVHNPYFNCIQQYSWSNLLVDLS